MKKIKWEIRFRIVLITALFTYILNLLYFIKLSTVNNFISTYYVSILSLLASLSIGFYTIVDIITRVNNVKILKEKDKFIDLSLIRAEALQQITH